MLVSFFSSLVVSSPWHVASKEIPMSFTFAMAIETFASWISGLPHRLVDHSLIHRYDHRNKLSRWMSSDGMLHWGVLSRSVVSTTAECSEASGWAYPVVLPGTLRSIFVTLTKVPCLLSESSSHNQRNSPFRCG